MFPDYQTLALSLDDAVLQIRLHRPDAANALNTQMALDLKDFFVQLELSECRVVILTGEGRHFCAGADLKDRKDMNEAQWHAQHAAFEAALDALRHCKLPVIAAVNGAAMGGGLELALACDFIYAASNARFALTEATLGIMPGLGGTQVLARIIGLSRAKECIFSGTPFSAENAYEWGMINRICPPESLMETVTQTAHTIANNAPLSIHAIKKAMNEGADLPLKEALKCELEHYHTLLATADRQEGINAFNEKRKPRFTGA